MLLKTLFRLFKKNYPQIGFRQNKHIVMLDLFHDHPKTITYMQLESF